MASLVAALYERRERMGCRNLPPRFGSDGHRPPLQFADPQSSLRLHADEEFVVERSGAATETPASAAATDIDRRKAIKCGAASAHRRSRRDSGEKPKTPERDGKMLSVVSCQLSLRAALWLVCAITDNRSPTTDNSFYSSSLGADADEEFAVDWRVRDRDRDGLDAADRIGCADCLEGGSRSPFC